MTEVLHILYAVPSISCEHCRRAIEDVLAAIAEVRQVHVDVAGKTVEVRLAAGERQAADRVRAAIEAAGHAVEGERLLEG
jgi:copper chaperone CopZ